MSAFNNSCTETVLSTEQNIRKISVGLYVNSTSNELPKIVPGSRPIHNKISVCISKYIKELGKIIQFDSFIKRVFK
jgi:hypothetical protein